MLRIIKNQEIKKGNHKEAQNKELGYELSVTYLLWACAHNEVKYYRQGEGAALLC